MADGDSITHVAVVILLLLLAAPALTIAYDYAGTPFTYNEEHSVDYTEPTSVEQAATVEGYGEITIIVGDIELEENIDYYWDRDAGEIEWLDTSSTNDNDVAFVEYEAYQRTSETEMAWGILAPLMGLFGIYGFIAAMRALWSFIAEVWDGT